MINGPVRSMSFFENILPADTNGIYTVLKNTCDQEYTFVINGPGTVYLGEGDLHDTRYNDMKKEISFTALVNRGVDDGTLKGLPLDQDGCQYSLEVYASSEFEDEFVTNAPLVYTIGAIHIFVFTSAMFILYDRLVEWRQLIVEREAKKSGAIVSSLFPEAYKNKLMEEQEQQMDQQQSNKLRTHDNSSKTISELINCTDFIEEQIADSYPDCTILFADISGFTRWSSERTPSQVFTLLQNLFASFDRVAMRRGVFKVETIPETAIWQ